MQRIVKCKIFINDKWWVDTQLKLSDKEEDAFIIHGRKRTKKVVEYLKKKGVRKVKIIKL